MRAFGPGSVSSFLKVVLDVVVVALAIAAVAVALAVAGSLLSLPFLGAARAGEGDGPFGEMLRLLRRGPMFAGFLLMLDLYIAALLLVADRLRRVFATLIAGRPFERENVERLRVIGLSLIVLEVAGYALRLLAAALSPEHPASAHGVRFSVNFTAGFAIVVVFVLAEVFREGARLQDEAELTI